jgi:hypothetical protein
MKSIALSLLLLSGLYSFADENTNVIAASDWSNPVSLENLETGHDHSIRGRLLIVAGSEPAYGGPKTDNAAMTFVELQNADGAYSESIDVCFDVMKLNCTLTDGSGKNVPKPMGGAWGGRGPMGPCWVTLPYNSTIRLFVNSGSKSPLAVYPNGEPWTHWSISSSDTNIYYLSGTLEIFTRTNDNTHIIPELQQSVYDQSCKGLLTFPKIKISANKQ